MTGPGTFQSAGFDIRCRDVWLMRKVRETAMMAYKRLEAQGTIKILYPVIIKNGQLEIVYRAQVPHEWILDVLRSAENQIMDESKRKDDEHGAT